MSRIIAVLGPFKAAHRNTLRAAGVRPRELRDALDGGAIRQVRRDWFVAADCDVRIERSLHARTTLACTSAAAVLGLWGVDTPELHVTATRQCSRVDRSPAPRLGSKQPELLVHWTRHPTAGAAPRARAIVDGMPRVLGQIARCQPLDQAVAVFDSAVRRGKTSMPELRVLAASDPAIRRVVEEVHPFADTGIESLPRVRFAQRGIAMIPQVLVDGHHIDGMIGERLLLQFDGFGPHRSRKQRSKDHREDGQLVRLGYIVLRYSADQVQYEWHLIESTVLAIIAQGRHLW
jgi:very-short-patch-repair endonuclease